jgi:hypothetical protein
MALLPQTTVGDQTDVYLQEVNVISDMWLKCQSEMKQMKRERSVLLAELEELRAQVYEDDSALSLSISSGAAGGQRHARATQRQATLRSPTKRDDARSRAKHSVAEPAALRGGAASTSHDTARERARLHGAEQSATSPRHQRRVAKREQQGANAPLRSDDLTPLPPSLRSKRSGRGAAHRVSAVPERRASGQRSYGDNVARVAARRAAGEGSATADGSVRDAATSSSSEEGAYDGGECVGEYGEEEAGAPSRRVQRVELSPAALEILHEFTLRHMIVMPPHAVHQLVRRLNRAWSRCYHERHAATLRRHSMETEVLRRKSSQRQPYNEVVLKEQVVYLRRAVDAKETDLARMERRLDLIKPADAGRAVAEGHHVARQRRLIERLGAELALLAEENHALRAQFAKRAFAQSEVAEGAGAGAGVARGATSSGAEAAKARGADAGARGVTTGAEAERSNRTSR